MTHIGPFQPLPFCDSVKLRARQGQGSAPPGETKPHIGPASARPTSATERPHPAAQLTPAQGLGFPICKIGITSLTLLCGAL